jgi:hypothetical protein
LVGIIVTKVILLKAWKFSILNIEITSLRIAINWVAFTGNQEKRREEKRRFS